MVIRFNLPCLKSYFLIILRTEQDSPCWSSLAHGMAHSSSAAGQPPVTDGPRAGQLALGIKPLSSAALLSWLVSATTPL